MDFLGAKWHLGTTSHFLVTLSITLIVFFIIFGGYQLLGKMQKKIEKRNSMSVFHTDSCCIGCYRPLGRKMAVVLKGLTTPSVSV